MGYPIHQVKGKVEQGRSAGKLRLWRRQVKEGRQKRLHEGFVWDRIMAASGSNTLGSPALPKSTAASMKRFAD